MDCQQVQQLIPFLDRPSEELDAVERAAAMKHLASCPACQALAQAEARADAAVSVVMRDVPVPADLQQKVVKRLSAQRKRFPWKRCAAAIAAVVLIGLSVKWFLPPLPEATLNDLMAFEQSGYCSNEAQVKKFLADEDVPVALPSKIDYQYLRRVEIVEFKKRRVAKLTFQRDLGNGGQVRAEMLILPHRQFKVDSLTNGEDTRVQIMHENKHTYVTFIQGHGDLKQIQLDAVQ